MAFLTRQEKYILIFLLIGAISGVSYSYYKRYNPSINLKFRKPFPKDDFLVIELDNLLKEAKSINLNEASVEELMKLKGVGPALAARIVEYRENYGPFKDKEEIKKVSGMGPKKLEAIKNYITLH